MIFRLAPLQLGIFAPCSIYNNITVVSLPGYGGQAERRPAGQWLVVAGGVQPDSHVAIVVERVAGRPTLVRLPQQRRDGPFVVARECPAPGQARPAAVHTARRATRPRPWPASLLLLAIPRWTAYGRRTARARPWALHQVHVTTRYRVHRVRRPLSRFIIDNRVRPVVGVRPVAAAEVHRPSGGHCTTTGLSYTATIESARPVSGVGHLYLMSKYIKQTSLLIFVFP